MTIGTGQILERLYPLTPTEEVARILQTTVSSVHNMAYYHGVNKLNGGTPFKVGNIDCKICKRCNTCKPLSEFHANSANKYGYEFHCTECRYPGSTDRKRLQADMRFVDQFFKWGYPDT